MNDYKKNNRLQAREKELVDIVKKKLYIFLIFFVQYSDLTSIPFWDIVV